MTLNTPGHPHLQVSAALVQGQARAGLSPRLLLSVLEITRGLRSPQRRGQQSQSVPVSLLVSLEVTWQFQFRLFLRNIIFVTV